MMPNTNIPPRTADDPASPIDRYFTYASMVIPSNDAFIGNGNPVSRPVFDAAGQFVGGSWIVAGDQVKDAGSEQNDELPANTAFFGQTAANTGAAQNGVVAAHAGFKAKGSGGILDAPMFAGADFKAANYQLARITLARSIYISEITRSAGNIRLAWAGGNGPYTVQERSNLADNAWRDVLHTAEQSASISISGAAGFFRIVSLSP